MKTQQYSTKTLVFTLILGGLFLFLPIFLNAEGVKTSKKPSQKDRIEAYNKLTKTKVINYVMRYRPSLNK